MRLFNGEQQKDDVYMKLNRITSTIRILTTSITEESEKPITDKWIWYDLRELYRSMESKRRWHDRSRWSNYKYIINVISDNSDVERSYYGVSSVMILPAYTGNHYWKWNIFICYYICIYIYIYLFWNTRIAYFEELKFQITTLQEWKDREQSGNYFIADHERSFL